MFMWQVKFIDTDEETRPVITEIIEKRGYKYPHTAQASSTWYLKYRLDVGISHPTDEVVVQIKNTSTKEVVRDSGKVLISDIIA